MAAPPGDMVGMGTWSEWGHGRNGEGRNGDRKVGTGTGRNGGQVGMGRSEWEVGMGTFFEVGMGTFFNYRDG